MNQPYVAYFWARFRGRVEVPFRDPKDAMASGVFEVTAERYAQALIGAARREFEKQWPLGTDRIHCIAIRDRRTGRVWF